MADDPKPVPLSHYSSPRIPGQTFDPRRTGYDHDTLRIEDMEHDTRIDPDDQQPHNPSRVPRTGMLLKGRNHPTFEKGVEEDRKLGYGLEMRDGRYYTQPFAKHERGGPVTPTPKTKGNLPHHRSEEWDESSGREVPSRPVEWYERADPNYATTPFTQDPKHGQQGHILEKWEQGGGPQRGFVYEHGGPVEQPSCKYGSSTVVTCKTKDR